MNKRGFTLVEVLAVLAIIGVILVLIVPNISKVFGDSITKTMKVQENEIKEAGLMYLEDYCRNPIGNNKCASTISRDSSYKYNGYILLSELEKREYIDEVSLQGTVCNGCVIYESSKAKVYLTCGEEYETQMDSEEKSKCNLN